MSVSPKSSRDCSLGVRHQKWWKILVKNVDFEPRVKKGVNDYDGRNDYDVHELP